jgi:DUF3047 family protein
MMIATMDASARIECASPGRRRGPRRADGSLTSLFIALGTATLPLAAIAQSVLEAAPPLPVPFSSGRPGDAIPLPWERVKLSDRKKPTAYDLVDDDGVTVLHARANGAASGLAQFTVFDIRNAPILEWRWRIASLVDGADNHVAATEDSPVRVLLAFDGDKSRLPLVDRTVFFVAEKLSGRQLPYALLQYIWVNRGSAGEVIFHPYTKRVRMIPVAIGPAAVGRWQRLRRNVVEDFRRAFGEEPGRLTGIGVLTDTDNTGGSVEAWYGDIRLLSGP